MNDTPSWDELKDLIATHPKPPIKARVVEHGVTERQAKVLYDGVDTWHIDDGTRIELTSARSTTINDDRRFETMRDFGGTASNNWVKTLVHGGLAAYLEDSTGQVVGSDEIEGRLCWVADVKGLREDDPTTEFRNWVDAHTGLILRISRQDAVDAVAELRDLEVGEVISPEEPGS